MSSTVHELSPRKATSDGEVRKVLQRARKRGWRIEASSGRNTHPRMTQRGHTIIFASTPSDRHAHKRVEKDIKSCERGTCSCRDAQPILKPYEGSTVAGADEQVRNTSTMTSSEAADYFGMSRGWVHLRVADGTLKTVGRRAKGTPTNITLDSIEALEASRGKAKPAKPKVEQPAPPVRVVPKPLDEQLQDLEDDQDEPSAELTIALKKIDEQEVAAQIETLVSGRLRTDRSDERSLDSARQVAFMLKGYALAKMDDNLEKLVTDLLEALDA